MAQHAHEQWLTALEHVCLCNRTFAAKGLPTQAVTVILLNESMCMLRFPTCHS